MRSTRKKITGLQDVKVLVYIQLLWADLDCISVDGICTHGQCWVNYVSVQLLEESGMC